MLACLANRLTVSRHEAEATVDPDDNDEREVATAGLVSEEEEWEGPETETEDPQTTPVVATSVLLESK